MTVRTDPRPLVLKGAKSVARAADVSTSTVKRWIASGLLRASKPGGRTSPVRVNQKDLDQALGRRRKGR